MDPCLRKLQVEIRRFVDFNPYGKTSLILQRKEKRGGAAIQKKYACQFHIEKSDFSILCHGFPKSPRFCQQALQPLRQVRI